MVYSIGPYTIDRKAYEIRRDGAFVAVEPQVFDLLVLLIENHERVVSKDEIIDRVWNGRIVSDATVSSRVKAARQAIGDDGTAQRLIRTVHGRGFRFVGEVSPLATTPPEATARSASARSSAGPQEPAAAWRTPVTRYATSGDVYVAFQVFGDGPLELVLAPGFVSHIENYWDDPHFAYWLRRLAEICRVIMFDKRGTGLSDRVSDLPGMDLRMDDVRAVMDAAGVERAVVMGISEGGSLASIFAATHPQRCRALVLYGAFARFSSWFPTPESLEQLFRYIASEWGSGKSLPMFAPSMADDPAFAAWWGKFERLGANPGAAIALMRMNSQIDIEGILPSIRVPTLVIHRKDDVTVNVEGGRFLARQIPAARYVELSGRDHLPWVGQNADDIVDCIGEFLATLAPADSGNRILMTIVHADISPGAESSGAAGRKGWEALFEVYSAAVRRELSRFRGSELALESGRFVAAFDGPGRAIDFAIAFVEALRRKGLRAQVGIHCGEVETLPNGGVRGPALNMAAGIAGLAKPCEILAIRTVKDLVAGSKASLRRVGTRNLGRGAEELELFAVEETGPA